MLDVEAWPLTSILKQKQNDSQPKSQACQVSKGAQIVGELIFLKARLIVYLELFWQRSMICCLFCSIVIGAGATSAGRSRGRDAIRPSGSTTAPASTDLAAQYKHH